MIWVRILSLISLMFLMDWSVSSKNLKKKKKKMRKKYANHNGKTILHLDRTLKTLFLDFIWLQIKQENPHEDCIKTAELHHQRSYCPHPPPRVQGSVNSNLTPLCSACPDEMRVLLNIIYGLIFLSFGDEKSYPNIMILICNM